MHMHVSVSQAARHHHHQFSPELTQFSIVQYQNLDSYSLTVTGRKQTTLSRLITLVISLECFIEITPDFMCPFMNDIELHTQ